MVKDPNCKNKRWHVEELDNLVFDEIKKLAFDPDYILKLREEKPEDERIGIIKKEIDKLDKQLERMMDLYEDGEMPLDIIQARIHKLNDKRGKLEDELEAIYLEEKKKLSQEETMSLVNSFEDVLESGDMLEIRAVIGLLINRIELDDDDVTIHWNFI